MAGRSSLPRQRHFGSVLCHHAAAQALGRWPLLPGDAPLPSTTGKTDNSSEERSRGWQPFRHEAATAPQGGWRGAGGRLGAVLGVKSVATGDLAPRGSGWPAGAPFARDEGCYGQGTAGRRKQRVQDHCHWASRAADGQTHRHNWNAHACKTEVIPARPPVLTTRPIVIQRALCPLPT